MLSLPDALPILGAHDERTLRVGRPARAAPADRLSYVGQVACLQAAAEQSDANRDPGAGSLVRGRAVSRSLHVRRAGLRADARGPSPGDTAATDSRERSEERRVGKAWVRKCRSRRSPDN